jgi:multidrug efflux pump subunit AcrA (membrane-fusion protein)
MNPRLKKILPVIILLIGGLIAFFMFKTPQERPKVVEKSPLDDAPYVQSQTLTQGTYSPELSLYGYLTSAQQINVFAPQGSKVDSVLVNNGDYVSKGQLIMTLSNDDLYLQQQQISKRIIDAQSQISLQKTSNQSNKEALSIEQDILKLNKQSVDRLKKIAGRSLTAAAEVENSQRNYNSQRLVVNNRQLMIKNHDQTMKQLNSNLADLMSQQTIIEKNIATLNVTADFDGRVENISVKPFDTVSSQAVMLLINDKTLDIKTHIALNQIQGIDLVENTQAAVTINNKNNEITLKNIRPLAESGAVELTFSMDNGYDNLVLNRYVNLIYRLSEVSGLYAVPNESVYSNNRVYLIEDTQLQRKDITVVGRQFSQGQDFLLIQSDENLSDQLLLTTRLSDAVQSRLVNLVTNEAIETIEESGVKLTKTLEQGVSQ